MRNKSKISIIIGLSIVGAIACFRCGFFDKKPQIPTGIIRVDIDQTKGVKTLYIDKPKYSGIPSPEGWIGWQKFEYHMTFPLGHQTISIGPNIITGDLYGAIYGYVIFYEKNHTIKIQERILRYVDKQHPAVGQTITDYHRQHHYYIGRFRGSDKWNLSY